MLLLDTNVVIQVVSGRQPHVGKRFQQALQGGAIIRIPSLVLFELRFGIAKSRHRDKSDLALKKFLEAPVDIVAFDDIDAIHAGEIRAHLERQGAPIGPYDLLIAAQARARNAVLATANIREFERVPGLTVTDWSTPP